ncbi:MAG: hypothetical protein UW68_C0015G0006 [Candidatus Collierbacteria bacterium GW2011_GWB1_44_6]|uniref:Uncharacterized protein n=1 Tax=Candidatus Collierbacteria bacterium GW2011_GWB1_44_6 TaxID=1618384 RepID=A0A0G1JPD0_9BACT|nr:MAG: hypothetical protein UW68_C0015G0006 [Candidatus Collierbacteria bacterium GW2011_GWB1_44_6]
MALINNEKYSLYYQRINLIYQRPEVKASLEIILSVFMVTILILAAIRPTLTNVASLQKRIEDLESVNKKADNKIAQVFNAQNQLNTYQDRLRLFDDAVPDGFSYQSMAGRIELLARRRNLTVQTIQMPGVRLFGTGQAVGDWSTKLIKADATKIIKTDLTFTVTGEPRNVRGFLSEIENMDRVTILNTIVLSTETGPGGANVSLRATGQISFYFFDENET